MNGCDARGISPTLTEPDGVEATSLDRLGIDWSRTVAWGEGGYYSRIFMNVRGREPEGIVEPDEYERVRAELAARIGEIPDELGRPIDTNVYRPEEVYERTNGVPPT